MSHVFKLFKTPVVALGMIAVSLFFMGQFALFTYVRPFLETVARVEVSMLSLILLMIGVAGFVGTILIGSILKEGRLYATLITIPVMMAAIALSLVAVGGWLPVTALLLGAWGLFATSAPVGWWTWLASTLPNDAEAGGGLMVAVVQLAITLGATVGGLLFDNVGYQSTFVASAAILLVAALLALLTARSSRRLVD
jgi:predicted MFS family arabinose efflux permease